MDTSPTESPQSGSPGSGSGKVCYVCNADLTGQRRYKNENGYYCPACARQMDKDQASREAAEAAAGLVTCPSCRRKLKPAAFQIYQGRTLCKQCVIAKEERPGLKVAKVELTHHAEHDKQRLYVLGAIAAVLGLISLLSYFGLIGR